MNYVLSVCYHSELIAETTYRNLAARMVTDPCKVIVLDNNSPLVKDKTALKRLCDELGFQYENVGKNLGLHNGYNHLISLLPSDCDRVILFDGDAWPVTTDWHIPLLKVLSNELVVWGSLENDHSYSELRDRSLNNMPAQVIIEGYSCKLVGAPVVNSICSFKLSWLKSIGGLNEPNRYYGGIEMYLWTKKDAKYQWVFIDNFREEKHPIPQEGIYKDYKWEHAHKGLDASFEEFITLRTKPEQSLESLETVRKVAEKIGTFHHHFYVNLDCLKTICKDKIMYVEIGTYAGCSAASALTNPKVDCISIDAGAHIPKEKVIGDIKEMHPGRNYTYIQGNSHDKSTLEQLKPLVPNGIDLLFIDGGHFHNDVIQDFEDYSPLVNIGGYIVFDDYSDYKYSSEVKPAVDKIVSKLKNYEIIGCFPNIFDAKVAYPMENNNCFIIKRIK